MLLPVVRFPFVRFRSCVAGSAYQTSWAPRALGRGTIFLVESFIVYELRIG